jgi:hypothetical protein
MVVLKLHAKFHLLTLPMSRRFVGGVIVVLIVVMGENKVNSHLLTLTKTGSLTKLLANLILGVYN